LTLLENGFGNLDLWAVESFGKVMEILTAQVVRTLVVTYFMNVAIQHLISDLSCNICLSFSRSRGWYQQEGHQASPDCCH
jgi:cobalamin biosynthesis Co2+ chelatase CbiK